MFNISFGEWVFLAIIALVVIGPKQLPEVARAVAKFLNELKSASSEASKTLLSMKDETHQYMNQVIHVENPDKHDSEKPKSPDAPNEKPHA